MNTEEILKQKYSPKVAVPTPQLDSATLSGTELLLREKYARDTIAKDTIATSPSEAAVEAVTKEALPVDEEASEGAVAAFKAAMELLELKAAGERAKKLVETIKRAREGL
ncbi:hypothetical protein [Pseudomonas sp. VI4.1]|uniref:hypothetical protein n=1 Tax=Pseudomonas sp. VI4.1 TaxID=1941346 RepID=UPI0009C6EFA7|nr:hypothetical protein [Pseudomonas sp. VI4.1]OPK06120.1 hypothetical protein BZ163_33775 [Pseudomonas sp. VI4.1]